MYKTGLFLFLCLSLVPNTWATKNPVETSAAAYRVEEMRIPDAFVSLDGQGETSYVLVVEKSKQQLVAYAYDGTYRKVYQCKSSTGEVPGPKNLDGDKKTPEGVYFFTKEHLKQYLSPIYGSRAFPIDYPNIMDRILGYTGGSVWMHGTNKPLKERDSNGCIVLENKDIDTLAPHIELNRTPVVIVETLHYESQDILKEKEKSVRSFITEWKSAIESGTYHQYLSFYSPNYLPDMSWWMEWNQIRNHFSLDNSPLLFDVNKTSILYNKGEYIVLFDQNLQSIDGGYFAGTRKLFVKPGDDGLKIIGEEYLVMPDNRTDDKDPLIAAATVMWQELNRKREITDLIDRWLTAWSSKNIKDYGNCYAKKFRSHFGTGRNAWIQYKNRLNKKYNYIHVLIEDLDVTYGKQKSTASFLQKYRSSGFQTVSKKTLTLIREGGEWKIYREISEDI
jgi:murein L,D-transpeptidase YafK